MDRAEHRGKWKRICCFILFLSMCLDVCAAAAGVGRLADARSRPSCKGDEFLSRNKKFCCNRCIPGYRLVEECAGNGLRSNCSICPPGQYLEVPNFSRNCFRCDECDPGEHKKVLYPCSNTKNTVCGCEDGYTKKDINLNTFECYKKQDGNSVNCSPPEPSYHWSFFVGVPLSTIAMAAVAVAVFCICVRPQSRDPKSPGMLNPAPDESPTEKLIISPTSKMDSCIQESDPVTSVLLRDKTPSQPVQLPDCIPQEFKFSPFVYFVLDLVPVDRFKELVRRLGVSERDIERAERDNHTFKESQHQMLKVWGESGGGGVTGTLPLPLVLDMLDTLRMMGLTACAEAIEEKYGIR